MYFSCQCSYFSQHYANWQMHSSYKQLKQSNSTVSVKSTLQQTASTIASYKLNTVHVFGHFGVHQLGHSCNSVIMISSTVIDRHQKWQITLFFPSDYLIFPVLFFMLGSSYYSQNYASIIRQGLLKGLE